MRDINKYLLAPIGENGSRPETNHIPIHSMTFLHKQSKIRNVMNISYCFASDERMMDLESVWFDQVEYI